MSYLILNDCHLGTQRSAGTTTESATQLKQFLFDEFERLIKQEAENIIILGDLFDKFSEDEATIAKTFQILYDRVNNLKGKLFLVGGNHDFSARGDKMSSFHLLCKVLSETLPKKVVEISNGLYTDLGNQVYCISHCLNQSAFDQALQTAIEVQDSKENKEYENPPLLLLHANLDNPYAGASDHSLNVNEEMAKALVRSGFILVFAHEHQHRYLKFDGKGFSQSNIKDADVIVLGNQTPSSISDCLAHGNAQREGKKYAHIINEHNELERIESWNNEGNFIRVEWDELDKVKGGKFVRVEGEVAQAQVDEVFTKIQKFRSKSDAFVITNAVKVEGIEALDEESINVSLDDIKGFDIKGEFFKLFSKEEQAVLNTVME